MTEKRKARVKHLKFTSRLGVTVTLIGVALLMAYIIGDVFSSINIDYAGQIAIGFNQAISGEYRWTLFTLAAATIGILIAYLVETRKIYKFVSAALAIGTIVIFYMANMENINLAYTDESIAFFVWQDAANGIPAGGAGNGIESIDGFVYYGIIVGMSLASIGAILIIFGGARSAEYVSEKNTTTHQKLGRMSLWGMSMFLAYLIVMFFNTFLLLRAGSDTAGAPAGFEISTLYIQLGLFAIFMALGIWLIAAPGKWIKRLTAIAMLVVGAISMLAATATEASDTWTKYFTLSGNITYSVFLITGILVLLGKIRPIHVVGALSKAEKELAAKKAKLEKTNPEAAAAITQVGNNTAQPVIYQQGVQGQAYTGQPNIIINPAQPETLVINMPANPQPNIVYAQNDQHTQQAAYQPAPTQIIAKAPEAKYTPTLSDEDELDELLSQLGE